eukprot:CAMPEP_0181487628 /NCGR_PEP_ID=MMETSP1110-20121109/47923_1 /TAXON_ID=174948 /ORGANISM="Symbiodinium sp., Strain CCMP421" /LENGTH=35 /DNA_ID= /DNA_START= /DNA_END= /DNA_ORIENTATION=
MDPFKASYSREVLLGVASAFAGVLKPPGGGLMKRS